MSIRIQIHLKDVQALSGLSKTQSLQIFNQFKKSFKSKTKKWYTIEEFCQYVEIDYLKARYALKLE
jgi:hypothetical protein